jgi:hypothetical protein
MSDGDEMDRECSTHERSRKCMPKLAGNPQRRTYDLENPDAVGELLL